jgi:hypothetical protein
MKKSKLKGFRLLLLNYLLISEPLLVTRFKDPKSAILTLKLLTGSRLICKIIPETACDKLILVHFPCSEYGIGNREHRPITEKGF